MKIYKHCIFFLLFILYSTSILFADVKPTIKIGAVLPLSGNAEIIGKEAKFALENGLKDSKKKKFDYQLILEDDSLQSNKSVTATKKLINYDNVSVIFSQWSYGGNAVGSTINKSPVINLATAWDINILNYGENNFLISSPPDSLAYNMLKKINSESKQNIVLLGFVEAGIVHNFNVTEKLADDFDIKIIDRIETSPEDLTIFKNLLLKLKNKKVDYLVVVLQYPQLLELFKQMKILKIDLPVFSMGQAPTQSELKQYLPSKWLNVDYEIKASSVKEILSKNDLKNISLYPNFYEAIKAIVEICESYDSKENKIPPTEWIIEKLKNYKKTSSLLGNIYYKDRQLYSDQIVIKNFLEIFN